MAPEREYIEFLQVVLPRLGLRWPGFRKVRGQVIKRLKRRLKALHLQDLAGYAAYLDTHPAEWGVLDAMCRISVSRFYRMFHPPFRVTTGKTNYLSLFLP